MKVDSYRPAQLATVWDDCYRPAQLTTVKDDSYRPAQLTTVNDDSYRPAQLTTLNDDSYRPAQLTTMDFLGRIYCKHFLNLPLLNRGQFDVKSSASAVQITTKASSRLCSKAGSGKCSKYNLNLLYKCLLEEGPVAKNP